MWVSKQTGEWDFFDNIKSVIPKCLHFSGNISNEYALEKLKQIKLVEILANASVELEEELDVLFEQLEEFKRNQESEQELQTQKSNIPDDPEGSLIGKKKKLEITWCTVDPNLHERDYQDTSSKRIYL